MVRWFIALLLIVVIGAVAYQAYELAVKRERLKTELAELNTEVATLEKEGKELEAKIKYYENEDNLEKELRSRFNYRAPDEKLIIVVPEKNE